MRYYKKKRHNFFYVKYIFLIIISGMVGYFYADTNTYPKTKGPILTTAGIVHICPENKIILIERSIETTGIKMFGGHVKNNESPETAFKRELMQELDISNISNLKLLGIHGEQGRDPRQHSVEINYSCTTNQKPTAGSDEKAVKLYEINEIQNLPITDFAFDHGEILKKYLLSLDNCNLCEHSCK